MVRLVLFDIDGTLIHSGGAGVRAFRNALDTAFQIPNGTTRLHFAGRTDTGLVRELFSHHQIEPSPENCRRFFDAYVFWLDHLLHQLEGGPCAGVVEFIHELSSLPERPLLGLLTGNIRLGAELKLRRYQLWESFETGAFGDDHEDRNVLAAVARDRGSRLLGANLRGEQVLVVGDTWRDIECARAIGARVIAVATGDTAADTLRKHKPDWLVSDLRDLRASVVCGR